MRQARARRREEAARQAAAIAEALSPRTCPGCSQRFAGAALDVHRDGRCLPGDAYGQLVNVDGVWCLRGSDAAGL